MYSKIILKRIQNMKYWISDQGAKFEFTKRMSLGSDSFEVVCENQKFGLRQIAELNKETKAILDLVLEFLTQYPEKQLEQCQFREFDYFLRENNSQSPFPEDYQINHIESCFREILFLVKQGPKGGLDLEKLTKIQQILALESFLKSHRNQFWDDNVQVELRDIDGKDLFLEIKGPGDLELYLDKVQESLIDFFQDYELNCILTNNLNIAPEDHSCEN